MADTLDVVTRSFNINNKLGPKLEAAAEQNAILRIGWTNAGDPVPKNGELGLCPGIPKGAKIRALGTLGSWTAAFGKGGSFTIQGDTGSFLGAANNGNVVICERSAGNYAGFCMEDGKISILDGCGDDLGSFMSGGLIVVRGNAGLRVGGGMSGGIIVVDGDIGNDPGAGMTGGKIIVNGRCPNPPEGVVLRPITEAELADLNKKIDDSNFQIPNDSVCFEPSIKVERNSDRKVVSAGDLSMIGLVPNNTQKIIPYATCDTLALLGERAESNTPIALPLPLMPHISDGKIISKKPKNPSKLLEKQPFIVNKNPRGIDFLSVEISNLTHVTDVINGSGGIVVNMLGMPSMNAEEIDAFLVALRSLLGIEKPFGFTDGVGRIESLHSTAAYHNADLAICAIEDETGISEAASLPLIGRSNKANLENTYTDSGISIGFSANAEDIAKLCAAGLKFVCCTVPAEDYDQIADWLSNVQNNLSNILLRLGIESIDALSRQNLRALDYETAAVSGLRLTGYERPLPHWFAR
ncbi:MAG: hypothetical protein VXY53_03300 [Candidatus Thermoplasmatota archaeon]|nr:hypothetical protein [Candidatus Thermoplasmatota archaeon]